MMAYRSMLFIPGHKPTWVAKGVEAGADALILDLEDAVPAEKKSEARQTVAESIAKISTHELPLGVWVRPNSWESGMAGDDIEAIVSSSLDGVFLPKVYGPRDIQHFDTLLTRYEIKYGVEAGSVKIISTLETAQAMGSCEMIATASDRVISLLGATARDADTQRALDYTYTEEGVETLYLRSRVLLANRAAGLNHPISGLWQDIDDLAGLKRFAQQNRRLGYRGQIVIHPSHVQTVNDVYGYTEEEVEFYRQMIQEFEKAVENGHAAVDYRGQHVDYAHAKTAREIVSRAENLGAHNS